MCGHREDAEESKNLALTNNIGLWQNLGYGRSTVAPVTAKVHHRRRGDSCDCLGTAQEQE